MEVLNKTVYRIMTTGTTSGGAFVIIPNTGVTYNFKINLIQETKDVGFQDVYDSTQIGTTVSNTQYAITGTCVSRLSELRKYTVTDVFANQYVGGGSPTVDGVSYSASIGGIIVYYLGGIEFIDNIAAGTTKFRFNTNGLSNPNFLNKPTFQNPNKENIISNPKINDDVFIVRQELSAFDKNYKLEYIKGLVDLETYAGGRFFNIVNNT